jgi:hypothetical protein
VNPFPGLLVSKAGTQSLDKEYVFPHRADLPRGNFVNVHPWFQLDAGYVVLSYGVSHNNLGYLKVGKSAPKSEKTSITTFVSICVMSLCATYA